MTRRQLKDATLRARELSAQGVAKAEIFNRIAPEVQKPTIAARIVASILLGPLFFAIFASTPVSIFKYKYGGYVGAVIQLLLMVLQSLSAACRPVLRRATAAGTAVWRSAANPADLVDREGA